MTKGGDCVANTLDSIYGGYKSSSSYNSTSSSYAYGMWNDQPDNQHSADQIYAHSKGIFQTDDRQGFYLIHSMPSFPAPRKDGYQRLPDQTYGQSFLCLTVNINQIDMLGQDLKTMHVFPFDFDIPKGLAGKMPNMVDAMNRVEDKVNQTRKTSFKTVKGRSFRHFSKGRHWGKDLYEDFVAKELSSDLGSNTWQVRAAQRGGRRQL